MLKRIAIVAILFLCAAFIRGGNQGSINSFTAAWAPLPLGAGGQTTAVYNYSDGTTLARGDSYGAWLLQSSGGCAYGAITYSSPCWQQIVTPTSIPGFSVDYTDRQGTVELVAAPSNTNVLYMLWAGVDFPNASLYVSTNRGTTWTKCSNFVGSTQQANNGNSSGPFIAVDPSNPDVILVDALGHGLYRSANGTSGATATFTQTDASTAMHVVAFQSSSHVVYWRQGTGAFESSTGPTGTFSAITTGSPPTSSLTAPHITADKFNQFWFWDAGGGTGLWRWASSSWSSISTGSTRQVAAFAADPNSSAVGSNHIMVADYGGQLNLSTNNGTSWTGNNTNETISVGASQPTWIGVANQNQGTGAYNLNGYTITFDQSSNILYGGGLGVWQATAPITAPQTSLTWNGYMLGQEQLVSTQLISPAGYSPLVTAWDKGIFLVKTPGVFPASQWDNSTALNPIIGGWAADWASADPTFITVFARSNISGSVASASSTDGGNTWTLWSAQPTSATLAGGVMATLDSQHWIVAPLNQLLQVTTNGGTSWANATVPGSPTNWTGQGSGFGFAADRVTASTYCVTNGATWYYSTNSGVTFSASGITSASLDGSAGAFHMKSVPGQAGNFLYTAGEQGGTHPTNTHLWKLTKTTNPCDTATMINANLKEVMTFGFGAHNPNVAGSYPTIYANGWFNGVQGIYQSQDGGSTWAAISVPASQTPWPLNVADFPADLEGDMDIYGRIYTIGAQSAGQFIDTADACPSIVVSNISPNAAVGSPVTVQATATGAIRATITSVNFYDNGSLIGTQTSGTPSGNVTNYSQSWSPATGAHALKVEAIGNGCGVGSKNSKTINVSH